MKRITTLIFLLFASALAYGQAEYLDETFGKEGMVITKTSPFYEYAMTAVVLPNGKILQCGEVYSEDGTNSFLMLRRYHPNGIVDSSFATNGTYVSTAINRLVSARIFPYADGKVLVVGQMINSDSLSSWNLHYCPFALRMLANGKTDDSFGTKGFFSEYTENVFEEYCSALIRDDGVIVLVGGRGDSTNMLPVITKLDRHGAKVSSFGDNGKVIIHPNAGSILITDANINSEGNCIFGGSYGVKGFKNTLLVRTDSNGALVSSFGNSGEVRIPVFDADEEVRALKLFADGSVLCLASIATDYYGSSCLVRLLSDGSPDPQFGSSGAVLYPERMDGRRSISFALDSNSNIVVVGYGGDYYGTIFRFLKDGSYDLTFGDTGEVVMKIAYYVANFDMAVQPDGKYVVAGWFYSDTVTGASLVYRLDPPQLSTSTNRKDRVYSVTLHPTPSTDNCTVTYTLPTGGNCTMTLRDESGRQVKTFATSEYRTAGEHKEELDLRDLAAGVYFVQIESGGTVQTAKVIKQ